MHIWNIKFKYDSDEISFLSALISNHRILVFFVSKGLGFQFSKHLKNIEDKQGFFCSFLFKMCMELDFEFLEVFMLPFNATKKITELNFSQCLG